MKFVFYIFIASVFISCGFNGNKKPKILTDTVNVKCLKLDDKPYLRENKNIYIFNLVNTNDSIIYEYHREYNLKNNHYNDPFSILVFKNTDSFILIKPSRDTCWFRGSKVYYVDGTPFLIKKYYNFGEGIDSDFEYVINDSLGIIHEYSMSWPNYCSFIKDSLSHKISQLLKKDKSGFVVNHENKHQYYVELRSYLRKVYPKKN